MDTARAHPLLARDCWRRRLAVAALGAALPLAVFALSILLASRPDDFHIIRGAAAWAEVHGWATLYRTPAGGYFEPPLVAWLAVPVGSDLAWLALTATAAVGAWALLAPGGWFERLLWLVVLAGSWPLVWGLHLGQPTPLMLLALAAAARLMRSGRPAAAGVALALALQVKPNLAFLVPLCLVAARQWRVLGGLAGAGAVIAAAYFVVIGPHVVGDYLAAIVPSTGDALNNGLTLSVLGAGAALGLRAASSVLAVGSSWRRDGEMALAAGIAASVLASPYLHVQDFVVLFVPAWIYRRCVLGWSWALPLALSTPLRAFTLPSMLPIDWLWLAALVAVPFVVTWRKERARPHAEDGPAREGGIDFSRGALLSPALLPAPSRPAPQPRG